MNRRNFIGNLLVAGASFMVLPGAGRVWKAVIDPRTIPNLSYRASDGFGLWCFVRGADDTILHDEITGQYKMKFFQIDP